MRINDEIVRLRTDIAVLEQKVKVSETIKMISLGIIVFLFMAFFSPGWTLISEDESYDYKYDYECEEDY